MTILIVKIIICSRKNVQKVWYTTNKCRQYRNTRNIQNIQTFRTLVKKKAAGHATKKNK